MVCLCCRHNVVVLVLFVRGALLPNISLFCRALFRHEYPSSFSRHTTDIDGRSVSKSVEWGGCDLARQSKSVFSWLIRLISKEPYKRDLYSAKEPYIFKEFTKAYDWYRLPIRFEISRMRRLRFGTAIKISVLMADKTDFKISLIADMGWLWLVRLLRNIGLFCRM